MKLITRIIFYVAMAILMIVSMWTTYKSLYDSILPGPAIDIRLGRGVVWNCSVFALGLSVAIGLMLFSLKLAIIDEQKRLNLLGLIGLTIVGFISIAFNLDVLYRTADRDFFMTYSNSKMKGVYEDYLREVQEKLMTKRDALLVQVAKQEGELDAEIRGLRQKPAGYGDVARNEDYQLTLLQKTTAVELETINQALAQKKDADILLAGSNPQTVQEIEKLQHEIRVIVKDLGAASGVPMPDVVKLENPLFAVFSKIFDMRTIGFKEVFFIIVALLLDLGDIIGYSMVPNRRKRGEEPALELPAVTVFEPARVAALEPLPAGDLPAEMQPTAPDVVPDTLAPDASQYPLRRPKRSFGFRRR